MAIRVSTIPFSSFHTLEWIGSVHNWQSYWIWYDANISSSLTLPLGRCILLTFATCMAIESQEFYFGIILSHYFFLSQALISTLYDTSPSRTAHPYPTTAPTQIFYEKKKIRRTIWKNKWSSHFLHGSSSYYVVIPY